MLDRKKELVLNLQDIKSMLTRVLFLENEEEYALDYDEFDKFYESLQYETMIIENIKEKMKNIVPELIYFKGDKEVNSLVSEIKNLNKEILKRNTGFQVRVKGSINILKKKLNSLSGYIPERYEKSRIINLRA